ncbi:MAG: hypothetical protein UX77_C0043G0001 [Parcubacteria group bacterium GW2011_GWA1_47_11]|nr:MAG: hypothetical protein UX77_C0043G0001 [Parcubacteria group bacterium GW2011_GWA1_47_11]
MIGSERRENSGCERRILRDVWKRILTDLGDIWRNITYSLGDRNGIMELTPRQKSAES